MPGDPSSHGFLSHHGFTIVNRTWEGGFDPSDSSLLLRLQRLAAGSGHFDVMCASDRPAPEELRQAAEFFERWYRLTHEWDPAAPWTSEQALAHFCGDDLVPGSLVRAYSGDDLIGAASLLASPFDEDELYLADIGVVGVDSSTATAVAAALTLEAIKFSARMGRPVRFEIDEANSALWRLLNKLDFSPPPNFAFYVQNRNAAASPTAS